MTDVLVIAPHADDETLGMGATIARLVREGRDVTVVVMTGHGSEPHPIWPQGVFDAIRREAADACGVLGASLRFDDLPAVGLRSHPAHLTNAAVARHIAECRPHSVYVPHLHDLHFDHGALSYAAIVATRFYLDQGVRFLAMYETPTETHLMHGSLAPAFTPNRFVDVSATFDRKLAAWDRYQSQHQAGFTPRSPDALAALARWRGAHIGVEYAEAFQVLHETV